MEMIILIMNRDRKGLNQTD